MVITQRRLADGVITMRDLTDLADFSDLPPELARRRVLPTKRAAAFLGYHVATLRRMVARGELPKPVRLSERLRGWRLGDLIDHLDARDKAA
jgi:predicted DNA-binding transcriptional regulator AlpA